MPDRRLAPLAGEAAAPEDVLSFWLDEIEPKDWYQGGAALDDRIRDRFEPVWSQARAGGLRRWRTCPRGALAYLILTDQFPRNMFRDTAGAFATDALALRAAKHAISLGWDQAIEGGARQFFYLPFEHSEVGSEQHRAVRLILERLDGTETLLHARAHRAVIRRFGRFPYRNAALGRRSTEAEAAMVEAGGYGPLLRSLQEADAAA